MTQLADWLHREIAANGPMTVSDYMTHCLLHEAHGYYTSTPVFGAEGDFITAPEISQLFGEMLAAFHTHLNQLFGAPTDCLTFEAGPGRGTLAKDMRTAYRAIAPHLHQAPCYLLEASPQFQQAQAAALAPDVPTFITDLSDLPAKPLFGVANEFFDALGVNQAIYHQGTWHERLIHSQEGQFAFMIGAPLQDGHPMRQSSNLPPAPEEGDIIEHSPHGEAIMTQLSTHIAYQGGGILIIDYGKPDNQGDSLQAVKDHKPADILSYQGEADITHWVDFARLSQIAHQCGARLIGPVAQGRFLQDVGIGTRAEALRDPDNPAGDRALLAAIDRLVSPAQMGHAFKVALLVPDGEGFPPGFASLEDASLENANPENDKFESA